jgi:hypothetical protein
MTRALRAIGVAILITATLHATAGICLCRRGQDGPAAMPAGHNCCHRVDATGRISIGGVASCCHIETAPREMTPTDAVQLAPPSAIVVADVTDTACGNVTTSSLANAASPAPPIQVLRL